MVAASIVAISAQQPGALVAKIPILYSWKKQTKPQKQKCLSPHRAVLATHPAHPVATAGLLVKDTVSSWEQDFMENHFCHDAPDRPDVHYQTPGD